MSVFTSKVVGRLFGTDEMRAVFSDERRIAAYLQIELALAKVEAQLGIIPEQAYADIAAGARAFSVDWDRLGRDVEAVGYPVLPFLTQLSEACGASGEYLHWGSTTRDITDTALALQLREALALIAAELGRIEAALLRLAERHRDTVTIGRTHGMHALPTTFGFRAAIWLSEAARQRDRLARLREQPPVGQFGGAVGTLAALGERGLDVQQALMAELGLRAPEISWYASRDRIAEIVFTVASIAGTAASIGKTLVVMTRNEVGEAREPAGAARGTSSAMPHKHNTVGSELVIMHGHMAAQQVAPALDAMVQDYDRDWQGHFESIAVPQVFLHAHAALKQMATILEGLQVFPERMRANIDVTRGQVMAESVMMALAPALGRKHAHRVVSALCNEALERDDDLRAVLARSPEIMQALSPAELDRALDPANYVGMASTVVDNVVRGVRAAARGSI
ncbi:adenylosuccinate lyase family protein [Candidimonas humi]|uniref:Adenylosuccinate lyase family protein n=1 Tax=Candidimonas humi TaxID=683355 RepID=A0ABV8NX47_9BURK|nr:adenylosuccinate lyase family protein [Candidimonas humi]MBV6305102.1 adenylosuccinate lyase family protein [Candidimonas humi]